MVSLQPTIKSRVCLPLQKRGSPTSLIRRDSIPHELDYGSTSNCIQVIGTIERHYRLIKLLPTQLRPSSDLVTQEQLREIAREHMNPHHPALRFQ